MNNGRYTCATPEQRRLLDPKKINIKTSFYCFLFESLRLGGKDFFQCLALMNNIILRKSYLAFGTNNNPVLNRTIPARFTLHENEEPLCGKSVANSI
jgi:hypothetical protein